MGEPLLTSKRGPIALIIIDGWGYSAIREGNAIALASTPYYDELTEAYPHTLLEASGTRVGLPEYRLRPRDSDGCIAR